MRLDARLGKRGPARGNQRGGGDEGNDEAEGGEEAVRIAKLVAVYAVLALVDSVTGMIVAFTSPANPLPEIKRKVLGILAVQVDYPRLWSVASVLFWAGVLAAAAGCARGASWWRRAAQAVLAVMIAFVIAATWLQHQSFTFLDAFAENHRLVVLMKAAVWAFGGSITFGLAYAIRRLHAEPLHGIGVPDGLGKP